MKNKQVFKGYYINLFDTEGRRVTSKEVSNYFLCKGCDHII